MALVAFLALFFGLLAAGMPIFLVLGIITYVPALTLWVPSVVYGT